MVRSEQLGPPYGPPANLAVIFAAWRDRGLPPHVDRAWFERIGLSANLTTRNLHALRYLRLVDEAARPTEIAARLQVAATDAFPATLAAIVRTSYARVWASCDPETDPRSRIEDAFRQEQPAAQRSRMVACFVGLCVQAGLPLRDGGPSPRSRTTTGRRHTPTAHRLETQAPPTLAFVNPPAPAAADVMATLLAKFPNFDPSWSDEVQAKWFDAFGRLREELRR
jgi:hypothetical protein